MSEIEEYTKEQSNSKVWQVERNKTLTSSNFGYVFDFKGTKLAQIGVAKESAACVLGIEK